jgi:hypothetical protein
MAGNVVRVFEGGLEIRAPRSARILRAVATWAGASIFRPTPSQTRLRTLNPVPKVLSRNTRAFWTRPMPNIKDNMTLPP